MGNEPKSEKQPKVCVCGGGFPHMVSLKYLFWHHHHLYTLTHKDSNPHQGTVSLMWRSGPYTSIP